MDRYNRVKDHVTDLKDSMTLEQEMEETIPRHINAMKTEFGWGDKREWIDFCLGCLCRMEILVSKYEQMQ